MDRAASEGEGGPAHTQDPGTRSLATSRLTPDTREMITRDPGLRSMAINGHGSKSQISGLYSSAKA